jgi:LytS/YehU family sensor histidine kinase
MASFFITLSLIIYTGNYCIQVFLYNILGCNWGISESERIWNNFFKAEFAGVIFMLGYLIVVFQTFKQESDLLQETINKENILFRYEKLKSQLDPHFLFNSFSILNSLILKDPKMASVFLNKLSEIYRYVLDATENDLVEVFKELSFIEDYLYLLKIRHQNSLNFKVEVPLDTYKKKIPVLALQLLVENAVKHNLFSSEIPLQISIIVQDNKLIVSNDFRPRASTKTKTGMGLSNINNRYKHLCNKEIEIENSGKQFIVKIPIL